jgi:hypothetical protein
MTIRGLLIWYLCGVACVGVTGASAYRVLGRGHPSGAAAANANVGAERPGPSVLAAEVGPRLAFTDAAPSAPPQANGLEPVRKRIAGALPVPPVPPSEKLPPLRHHLAVASIKKHPTNRALASARQSPYSPPSYEAPPPPYPYYAPAPTTYATAQSYYYPYYLYYRSY